MSIFVVNILEGFLGPARKHTESKGQVKFDCPSCAERKGLVGTDGKGNLEINYNRGIFKCWSCYDTDNMHGFIPKLIKRFGNSQQLKDYLLLKPMVKVTAENREYAQVKLPEGFIPLTKGNEFHYCFGEAKKYLRDRNVTDDIIERYNIGFTTVGDHKFRVIVPSYDADDVLNFFVARAFRKRIKPKYLNPEAEKEKIIFNEKFINWDSTIYLVEGVFDAIVAPNTIPLLGKVLSDDLLYTLQTKAKGLVVIVLDGDAQEDAKLLYKRLNSINLHGRVRIVELKGNWDLSQINQELGRKEVVRALASAHTLMESRL